MRNLFVYTIFTALTIYLLTSCRPPELEGAYVDYNAKRMDTALELAKEATDKYPTNAEAPYLLGKIYGEKGMFKEMTESFDKSLERSADFKNQIKESKVYYYQSEYKTAYDNYIAYQKIASDTSEKAMKMLSNAIEHADNASIITPNDYSSIKLAGLAANYKKDTDKASKKFEMLTTIKPDTVDSWFQLGRLYFNSKDYNKAIVYNKKAFELDNSYVPAIELLAFSYEGLKDTANAIQAYKDALNIEPNNISYLFNLGLIFNKRAASSITSSEEQITNYANAETYFVTAINLDPDELADFQRDLFDANLEILYSLTCVAQIQQRKFEECKETTLSGIDNFPDSADLHDYLAICLSNLGDVAGAKDASEKAKQLREE
jgi:tetratricopeptide (TPR) repeat protein